MSGNFNFLLGFVPGLCIIGGLVPLRNPPGHPSATKQDQWVTPRFCPPSKTLETEDEFERARR